jgi:thioesterase domain-containing protein
VTVAEFLGSLRALDIQVSLQDDDRLRVNAPAGALSDTQRAELARRKAEIVDFLRVARDLSSQQGALVPLRSGGRRVPIFGVGGHNGDVFCYRALVQHLDADQPFYGLQPKGVDEGTTPFTTIEELAGYFAAQIRAAHGDGPLVLAGFCAGGTIALELAQQLRAAGVDVRDLILFGAPHPAAYRPLLDSLARASNFVQRGWRYLRYAILASPAARRKYLADRAAAKRASAEAETDRAADPVMVRRRTLEDTTIAAIQRYRPTKYAGRIELLYPNRAWTRSFDRARHWRELAASHSEFFGPEACDSSTMLLPEHAAAFAAEVERLVGRSETARR